MVYYKQYEYINLLNSHYDIEAQYQLEDYEYQIDFLEYSISKIIIFYTRFSQSFNLLTPIYYDTNVEEWSPV